MTNTERGLLDQVLANPDDDAPRLILADWWEENGRERRAEFVRVQCELAKLSEPEMKTIGRGIFGGDETRYLRAACVRCRRLLNADLPGLCEYHTLKQREAAITRVDDLTTPTPEQWWIEEIAKPCCMGPHAIAGAPVWEVWPHEWHRGFVSILLCDAGRWLSCWDGVRSRHPIRSVSLQKIPVDRENLLALAKSLAGLHEASLSPRFTGTTLMGVWEEFVQRLIPQYAPGTLISTPLSGRVNQAPQYLVPRGIDVAVRRPGPHGLPPHWQEVNP